jgi:ubiquinone/menaquinone biosynthesis C-methylase UbiE
VDVAISTLTLGHIGEVRRAIQEWSRVLKPGGRAIITDFHPAAFRIGLKRTFVHQGRTIEAENHYHPVPELGAMFQRSGFAVLSIVEGIIDETVRPLFERQDRIEAYRRYMGTPIVVGFHLERAS